MPAFHETTMGRKFFDKQLPELIEVLKDIAKELKKLNEMSEYSEAPKGEFSADCEKYLEDV